MEVIREYPSFFTTEEGDSVGYLVTLEEIKMLLEGFDKSKSPGPNGWLVEFFHDFFDILGEYLLTMVEEYRVHRKACGALNSNFISLIPNKYNIEYFKDFRPIALCNLVYNIISKIIANKIKHFLSKYISKE